MNRKLLNEGGNAIKQSIPIKREYIPATLNYIYTNFLPKVGLTSDDVATLGSTGKKDVSGDLDIGMSFKKIIQKNSSVNTLEDVFKFFMSKASSAFPEVVLSKGINVISVACPIVGSTGYCQADFMLVDNLEFAQFIYYSPTQMESQYKGLYRNELLFIIIKYAGYHVTDQVGDTPTQWERYFIDMNMGLMKKVQGLPKRKSGEGRVKNPVTINTIPVSNDVETVLEMIFGPGVKPEDINTFEKLYKLTQRSDFPYRNDLSKIYSETISGIKHKGYPVPEELL